MLALIFIIGLDLILSLAVMTGVWIYFNREAQIVLEIKKLVGDISDDLSKLLTDFKTLRNLTSDVVQPLFNSQVIDIESKVLTDLRED